MTVLGAILILGIGGIAGCLEADPALSISMLGGGAAPGDMFDAGHGPKALPSTLHFVDQPVHVRVAMALPATTDSGLDLPVAGWHEILQFKVRSRDESAIVPVRPRVIETGYIYDVLEGAGNEKRLTSRLLPGEAVYCHVELGTLRAGRYAIEVSATLPDGVRVSSRAVNVLVMTGNEDERTRRAYLRSKIYSVDREERLEAVMELAKLEPENPVPWETLAWDALRHDKLDEARSHLAKARAVVAHNLANKPPATKEGREGLQRREQALSTIERVYEFARANEGTYGIMANVNDAGEIEFFWVAKASRRPVARVNPEKPEEMLPLPRRQTIVIDK